MAEDRFNRGWVGVDLDGTLAVYDGWRGIDTVGAPVPAMVRRVQYWLSMGQAVRIVTARVAGGSEVERSYQIALIGAWCKEHLGTVLPVVATKDFRMIELWDDRVVAVEPNTGRLWPLSAGRLPDPPAEWSATGASA